MSPSAQRLPLRRFSASSGGRLGGAVRRGASTGLSTGPATPSGSLSSTGRGRWRTHVNRSCRLDPSCYVNRLSSTNRHRYGLVGAARRASPPSRERPPHAHQSRQPALDGTTGEAAWSTGPRHIYTSLSLGDLSYRAWLTDRTLDRAGRRGPPSHLSTGASNCAPATGPPAATARRQRRYNVNRPSRQDTQVNRSVRLPVPKPKTDSRQPALPVRPAGRPTDGQPVPGI